MVTKKVSTPYCHQASYLGPHPPGRKGSKLRMLWHRCTNRLHILGDKIHSGPWNIIKLKSVFTLLFAGEALDIKARPPNLKLLCWRDAFTHVSPRKWASGIQRPSLNGIKLSLCHAMYDKPMRLCFWKLSSCRNLRRKLGITSFTSQVPITKQMVNGWSLLI